jgi:hypothetical protein
MISILNLVGRWVSEIFKPEEDEDYYLDLDLDIENQLALHERYPTSSVLGNILPINVII